MQFAQQIDRQTGKEDVHCTNLTNQRQTDTKDVHYT